MVYALSAILVIFLIFLFFETKRKSERIHQAVQAEKRQIAEDSGMTASIGVFSPDVQTTVIIGASDELGVFYYRMLKQVKVSVKSRINLANLARIECLLNGNPQAISVDSELATSTLKATEAADQVLSQFSQDSIRQIQKAAIRIIFYDETGLEKNLEITTFRSNDERQKFERVQLLKNTIWWVAFLQIGSKQARRVRAKIESEIN